MKDFDAEDYKAKSNLKCPQNDDKQSGKGGRKKRQTGPKEDEEVVAEYQREADFMRKRITLYFSWQNFTWNCLHGGPSGNALHLVDIILRVAF